MKKLFTHICDGTGENEGINCFVLENFPEHHQWSCLCCQRKWIFPELHNRKQKGLWIRHVPCSGSAAFPTFSLKEHFVWATQYVLGEGNSCCIAWWCAACCAEHCICSCIAVSLLFQVTVLVLRLLHWFLSPVSPETPSKLMVILAKQHFQIKNNFKETPNNLCWGPISLPPCKCVMKTHSEVHINTCLFWDELTTVQIAKKEESPVTLLLLGLVSC